MRKSKPERERHTHALRVSHVHVYTLAEISLCHTCFGSARYDVVGSAVVASLKSGTNSCACSRQYSTAAAEPAAAYNQLDSHAERSG